MSNILLPLLTFFGGFYLKKYFDNRDLRRKILEPVFDEYENLIIYLQTEWRHVQNGNVNERKIDEYSKEFNAGRNKLIKTKNDIIFACKKIREKELIPLVDDVFSTLFDAMNDYSFFLDMRDNIHVSERQESLKTLNEANDKFDRIFPSAMEEVYNRYWELISGIFVTGIIYDISKVVGQKWQKRMNEREHR